MVLMDNEYALISYEKEAGFISIVWKKYAPSAAYREVVTELYEFRKALSVSNLLSDNRNLPTISEADGHWTVDKAKQYYELIKHSRLALVVSESSFVRLAMESMLNELKIGHKEYAGKSHTRYFSSWEAARNWLAEDNSEQ